MIVFSAICVLSDRVVFVQTRFGNQFHYNEDLLFAIAGLFVLFLVSGVFVSHFKWWRRSEMKRHRRQQLMFLIFTVIVATLGIATNPFLLTYITGTIPPLTSVVLFPAGIQLFFSMKINNTLSITVPNVAAYTFKSIMLPILVLDHRNIVSLGNKAAQDFFGSSMYGRNIAEIITFDEDEQEVSFLDRDVARENVTVETLSGTKNCDMLLSRESDKYGDALCKIVILRDITENVELIRNLRETSEHLELALRQANAASKAKSDFLSNMSHEMRTPMNAVLGMTTIGTNARDIQGKNHALNRIGDASSHLLGVINDVLDMAKIEADKLELAPVPYNFSEMLQKVLSVIGFRVEEKKQTLSINVDGSIPQVIIGDDQRLAQVITNILANSVKFTPEGGAIRLDASLAGETGDHCILRLEVTDNGIGISPEQQGKLFRAFEQVDDGISREYEGTGLGLVISKRIIDLMGGEIQVESKLGKGARFTITAKAQRGKAEPLRTGEMHEATAISPVDAGCQDVPCKFDGRNILVVEDVEVNREIVISLLESTSVTIDCAENGKEALDMIAASPDRYDLVFMDMQMPQMDGLEATRRIRALPAPKLVELPIIAMTANVFRDDIEACLNAGMDDHLGKPLDIDKVMEKMQKYLSPRETPGLTS